MTTEVTALKEQLRSFSVETSSSKKDLLPMIQDDVKDLKLLLAEKLTVSQNKQSELRLQRGEQDLHQPSVSGIKHTAKSPTKTSTKNNLKAIKSTQASSQHYPARNKQFHDTKRYELQKDALQTSSEKDEENSDDEEQVNAPMPWTTVNNNRRRRKRSLIKGSRKDTGLKGIQETRDLYIGRCHTSVSIDEIVKYINDVTGIQPISGIQISKPEVTVKAFKVTVGSSDIEKLLDGEVWPENICVRKYLNRRPRYFPANW